jgi:hypothetical protein
MIAARLGDQAVQPAPTNLIFLNRSGGDAQSFVEALERYAVRAMMLTPSLVRLAIHHGVHAAEIEVIAAAVAAADIESRPPDHRRAG